MSQPGDAITGAVVPAGGPDFNLPDEILAAMPADPYEQLDLARKITSLAIASRVSKLEAEVSRMRDRLQEKDRAVSDLQERFSVVQRALYQSDSRLKLTLEDNSQLAKEKDALAMTVKKLGRDLAKLETFKRQLMQSLNDDTSSSAETVDIGTCDHQSVPITSHGDNGTNGYGSQHSFSGAAAATMGFAEEAVKRQQGPQFSITPYITPCLTPTGTPKMISASVSPRGYSAVSSPQKTSGRTTPTKSHYNEQSAISSWYSSSQQSSAANSPPRGRPIPGSRARIDGKEFFRLARSRLSYEQFSAFLANIKELNAQKQTREETLRKAEEIFGNENKDLYISFKGLLNRNNH